MVNFCSRFFFHQFLSFSIKFFVHQCRLTKMLRMLCCNKVYLKYHLVSSKKESCVNIKMLDKNQLGDTPVLKCSKPCVIIMDEKLKLITKDEKLKL